MNKAASRPTWQNTELDKQLVIASYFGFTPMSAPRITDADIAAAESCADLPHYDAVEKAALIRTYIEQNFADLPHPLALAYRKPAGKKRLGGLSKTSPGGYALHYIGAPTGIAEAALIRAALSILSEEGHKSMRVDLNCIGDKDSLASYERELGNFIRKSGGGLPEELRASLKTDVFNLFRHEEEAMIELAASAPPSINFLTSAARAHFKEVLEFVESLGVEFGLDHSLIAEKNHASHTVFGIRPTNPEGENVGRPKFLALGYRYSRLGKKMGLRKEVPMAGLNIFNPETKEGVRKIYKDLPKARFYLVQLGREAKMKTLGLIEMLRREKIPVHHFIGKDKLDAQLQGAEEHRVPYLIIIGHKEALDGTATIRNVQTRAQDTIPMEMLPNYLRNIKL